jgi:hypothetical protein
MISYLMTFVLRGILLIIEITSMRLGVGGGTASSVICFLHCTLHNMVISARQSCRNLLRARGGGKPEVEHKIIISINLISPIQHFQIIIISNRYKCLIYNRLE